MVLHTAFQPPLSEHRSRVIQISGKTMGSAFYVDFEDKQYLLTAAHVVGADASELKIKSKDKWISFPCSVLAIDEVEDIIVLKMPISFKSKDIPVELSAEGLLWGQPVWFLGFPFGDGHVSNLHADGILPMPYVKWAFLSSFGSGNAPAGMILDGHNNIGFSGGPVGFMPEQGVQKFCGLIVGYKEEIEFVEKFIGEKIEERLIYKTNTGLIRAVDAWKLLELIASNPSGARVQD
jgi:Trypsin-like peptidase domain